MGIKSLFSIKKGCKNNARAETDRRPKKETFQK